MKSWADEAFFYHLFPLGVCGAPWTNPGGSSVDRIEQLVSWIEPASRIGANAVLLGPIWESGTHGYDTFDYTRPRSQAGNQRRPEARARRLERPGVPGRFRRRVQSLWPWVGPFLDLKAKGPASEFKDWFAGVDFSRTSRLAIRSRTRGGTATIIWSNSICRIQTSGAIFWGPWPIGSRTTTSTVFDSTPPT